MRLRLSFPCSSIGLIFLLAAAPSNAAVTGSARPVTVDDLVALVRAGVGEAVILEQVEATGTRLSLSADDIVLLKRAGASDTLLAALIGSTAPRTEPAPSQSFRIYREKNDSGEEVLHITNLDASGRRIGGEVEEPTSPSQIGQEPDGEPGRAPADVYPQQPDAGDSPMVEEYEPERSGFAGPAGYGGYLIAYGSSYQRRCAHSGGYPGSHGGAPGSRPGDHAYRQPGGGDAGLFSRPRVITTLPYRTNTAAERNRARFGHH